MRRRELVLAAAAALVGARPAAAAAAGGDVDVAVLQRLIGREEAAALAQRRAAVLPVAGLAGHEADHAKVLRTDLFALGGKVPPAPGDGAALDPAARRLAEAEPAGRVDAAIALEASLLAAYTEALLELQEPNVVRTAASIMASHAQHEALLRRAAGRDPFG
jgi:hypothetical protein